MVPKLVADDIPLLHSLLSDVFPGVPYRRAEMTALKKHILSVCNQLHYVYGEDNNSGAQWVDKVTTTTITTTTCYCLFVCRYFNCIRYSVCLTG